MTLRIIALLIACCGLTQVAHSQTTPQKPATLRFLFVDESPGAYFLKVNQDFRRISSAPYSISAPYTPSTLGRLDIYKSDLNPDPITGKIKQNKVLTITPPANTIAALVIVTPKPQAPSSSIPLSYAAEFIDDSPSAFPAGSLRILNRGHATMAARLAKEQVLVAQNSVHVVKPTVDHRGLLRVRIAVQAAEKWKRIDDNVLVVAPDSRVTGVLVYSPSGMKHLFSEGLRLERGDPPPTHYWITYSDTLQID